MGVSKYIKGSRNRTRVQKKNVQQDCIVWATDSTMMNRISKFRAGDKKGKR